jgi:hypothetical protein
VLLFAGSTALMARLSRRFYGPEAGLWSAVSLNLTAYFGVAAGAFVLPDGPLLFFWLLTLDRLAAAFQRPDRAGLWTLAGLAWGASLLSKYHGILILPGVGLYLLVDAQARREVRNHLVGPAVALLLGGLLFAPVLWWNASHHWASFLFQGGRAVGGDGLTFRPESLFAAIGGPVAYLLPWIWFELVAVVWRTVREREWSWSVQTSTELSQNNDVDRSRGQEVEDFEARRGTRFLLAIGVIPIVLFAAVASLQPILPHWSLIGFATLLPLLGRSWAERFRREQDRQAFVRRLATYAGLFLVLALAYMVQARTGFVEVGLARLVDLFPRALKASGFQGVASMSQAGLDPSLDQFGWDQVAAELDRRGLLGREQTFLFTGNWRDSGQLAYATRGSQAPVLCYHPSDARGFAFWSQPEEWVGWDGILVSMDDHSHEPDGYDRWFEKIEPIFETMIVRNGVPVRRVRAYHCTNQLVDFPFDRRYRGEPLERLITSRDGEVTRF